MNRLIVISNRVTVPKARDKAQAGGLAMALAAALREYRGVWFGWSGKSVPQFTGQISMHQSNGVTVALTDLEEADVQEYYNGYANKTLWPLFHYRNDLTAYDRSFNLGYQRVNARFADTVRPLIDPDDFVWVHDYHLIPLGRELRQRGVKGPLGFFLHIPWPARQLLVTLPRDRALVEALFSYDLVGFHTEEWLDAFVAYVLREAGGTVLPDGRLSCFGRTIRAAVFPIGIDASNFVDMLQTPDSIRARERVERSLNGRRMIIGVDRLDYSKGLEERFVAYEHLLATRVRHRRDVFMLQIATPSRGDVGPYQNLRAKLDALAGRINGGYADVDWVPLRYVNRAYRRDELAGMFRAAQVGFITPLRDGMNLVAKEYIAAQDPEDPGVLVLSRFAGAALQMKEALIVNPFSREEMADALDRALTMDLAERKRRFEPLMHSVMTEDVAAWRDNFVNALREAAEVRVQSEVA
ncbi:alpha,alpha-trehalose-phosphate synthase (UDP-forming) [Pararhodospirillum oryzae]|uniref:Trehalose-6-phosphate synthase n=1 Tax=Pararhodospirillum oryzae TaxID=478448 RepID=A0A512H4G7_9PROT|nr:trehalose-6-phosphate synthase [Pararhodospirillum oryzae]GEO80270.1 trehalose-6-phosphate synthase [Pararhodospirillum oryzae]